MSQQSLRQSSALVHTQETDARICLRQDHVSPERSTWIRPRFQASGSATCIRRCVGFRSDVPAVADISYARLESGGLRWPCRDESDPETTVLHAKAFAKTLKAKLECIDYGPTEERCSAQFPFLLTTGRNLYQFNAGTTRSTCRAPMRLVLG